MKRLITICAVAALTLALSGTAQAVITIDTVTVGNPGNAGEWTGVDYGGTGWNRICGAVGYEYLIGKYEVTAGQYTEFLNAVAKTDTYGLYSSKMSTATEAWLDNPSCRIQRSGESGSYTYSVAAEWANRPVNYVSWGDAARFANWLHNGQPTGAQDLTTTEDGAYYLNGATTNAQLLAVSREADWKWAITSDDEWYKAAYYNPATGTYYDYPTSSNTAPGNDMTDASGNNANYWGTLGSPYYRTEVGEFENSDSPYGTFDQGGNVWEWNEAIWDWTDPSHPYARLLRGGSFYYSVGVQASNAWDFRVPTYESYDIGFRVSETIPAPGALVLGGIGVAFVGWMRRRRSL